MSFNFTWPDFSAEFYEYAVQTLTTALNRGQKPKSIVGDIHVKGLHMGRVPPELEILEIGDLSRERFEGSSALSTLAMHTWNSRRAFRRTH